LLIAGTLMAALACLNQGCRLTSRSQPTPADPYADTTTAIDLEVTNHNWNDVVVYVRHGGIRTRLGTVGTAKSIVLRFPRTYAYAAPISLIAAPIGNPSSFESERFIVQSGQSVFWTVENSLQRSSLMIR
jgi:hypothetical protein